MDDMRQLIKNFRVRYKQAVNEIRDLNEEHAKDQAEYFESSQTYEREISLYKAILKSLIDPKELQKLETKCSFNHENKKWTVPLFNIHESSKQVSFPKLLKMGQKLSKQVNHD